MKNIFISLVLILFSSSCSFANNSQSSTLYSTFLKYENTVNEINIIEVAADFFSSEILKRSGEDDSYTEQLLFKAYMTTKDSHFEKVNTEQGCLTINGYDEDNAPIIFSLKYIPNNESWLIDEIHIAYFDSEKDFTKSAKCPTDFPDPYE